MTGKILHFDLEQRIGVISGNNGSRYSFVAAEVRNMTGVMPQGAEVDFVIDEDGNTLDIYIVNANQYAPNVTAFSVGGGTNGLNSQDPFSKDGFRELFSLNGCYSRTQYWRTVLLLLGYNILLMIMARLIMGSAFMVTIVVFIGNIPALWVGIANSVKRFHDINKSGVWVLVSLLPVIGGLIVLIMNGFLPTQRHNNRYCPNSVS